MVKSDKQITVLTQILMANSNFSAERLFEVVRGKRNGHFNACELAVAYGESSLSICEAESIVRSLDSDCDGYVSVHDLCTSVGPWSNNSEKQTHRSDIALVFQREWMADLLELLLANSKAFS